MPITILQPAPPSGLRLQSHGNLQPSQNLHSPPVCIRICAHCDEEITVSESGVISVRGSTYHPACVQCHSCQQRVDGSLLDTEGRMVCVSCMRKKGGGVPDGFKVSLTRTPSLNTSLYSSEAGVSALDMSEWEAAFLAQHNKYRGMHKVEALAWSAKLTSKARRWAIHLIARNGKKAQGSLLGVEPMSNSGLGQTCCTIPAIAKPTQSEMADRVCEQWYETGSADFCIGETQSNSKSAPFTQMVWKSSQRVGACLVWYCQVALVVAFYWPPGNVENEFGSNVSKVMRTPRPARRKIKKGSSEESH